MRNEKTKITWTKSFANELGKLANGVDNNRVKGTQTIKFIKPNKIPKGKFATYGRIVVDFKPHKNEPNRTRLTVGGNLIHFEGSVRTPTADMITAKLLLNSVVSTPRAKCLCLDINNFYLNNNLPSPEYMRLEYSLIPQEIKDEYQLDKIVHDGQIYIEISKGMYGLPQAGKIANQELIKHLAKFGYHQCRQTPGLWKHRTRKIMFALVVDDFAIRYIEKEDAKHLI